MNFKMRFNWLMVLSEVNTVCNPFKPIRLHICTYKCAAYCTQSHMHTYIHTYINTRFVVSQLVS